MDKTQADAVAQAILQPAQRAQQRAQEDFRKKRALKALQLKRQRRIALFTLSGCAFGALIAYLASDRVTVGILWGGLGGSAVGWLATRKKASEPIV